MIHKFLFIIVPEADGILFILQQVKNKIVREVIEVVKGHQLLIDQILQEDLFDADELTMEHINLVAGVLSKV